VKGTRLLEAAAFIKVTVENGLGLANEVVAFIAIKRMVKAGHFPTAGFDALENGLTTFVDTAKEQQIDGAIFDGQGGWPAQVGGVLKGDDRDIAFLATVSRQVSHVVVNDGRRTQQIDVRRVDGGTSLTELFKIEEDESCIGGYTTA
jgi:hypothetical protein